MRLTAAKAGYGGAPASTAAKAGYGGAPASRAKTVCRRGDGGIECTDFKSEHREMYDHPKYDEGVRLACVYGLKCYQKNIDHLRQFVHPGDRNYREGMVYFGEYKGKRVQVEFPSVKDLFNYCDPDESGNISREEFQAAFDQMQDMTASNFEGGALICTCEEAWMAATRGDEQCTHLSFVQFAKWASDVGIRLPMGMDVVGGGAQKCRFEYSDGIRKCPCREFTPSDENKNLCRCGHKSSAHLSDTAVMTVQEQDVMRRINAGQQGPKRGLSFIAPGRKPGFDMVTDKATLADLQKLLTDTVKHEDSWTRDRGCSIHGRNNCEPSCIFAHRARVPKAFELVRAERNRNPALRQAYDVTKARIKLEIVEPRDADGNVLEHRLFHPLSSIDIHGEEPLDQSVNEWRVFHGTGLAGCKGICGTNFNIKMAGTGATWKEGGKSVGTPLYGWGVYLAERSTKADEYCEEITEGLPLDIGCHAMLVCRTVGGLTQYVDTNEFDVDDLRKYIYDGPYHSVFGDRETKLGKPYKEIVEYNKDHIFPEFILYYKRIF